MKVESKIIKDTFVLDDGEQKIFPETRISFGVEVVFAVSELHYDIDSSEWIVGVDVWGYNLTKKGTRDKRSGVTQVFGFFESPERRKFIADIADAALDLNGLTRADVPACASLFENIGE